MHETEILNVESYKNFLFYQTANMDIWLYMLNIRFLLLF